ncbi:MAG: hypothetical protein KDK70_18750 [Myxococcales bacterium]|nr:hypothetical protein [Myxococcales bacterium]
MPLGLSGCPSPEGDSELARGVIGPDGGIVSSVDSVLTIAIPPGALEQTHEFFIERTSEPPEVFGQAYLVRPNPEVRYDVTVTYRGELPEDTSTVAVGAVDALAYEQGSGQWEPLPVLRIDAEDKLVGGLDDGISIFYALLDDAG